ncbi:MAG TPA: OsmC family protein [Gemmatimonadales bacterium]|nr:OsmC family protein [Gemmatimonadales bacterium]
MTRETKHVTLSWLDGLRFEGGAPGGPTTVIDADNATAPGPMLQLLLAAAACTGSDVVDMLPKMRVKLASLRIEASGVRRETPPRRYVAIHLRFRLSGEGLDEAKARRAVELSLAKYCSVVNSLAPDIDVTHEVSVE